jgi:hypothetical protein
MNVVGMSTRGAGQSHDSIAMDTDETPGLANAIALGQVFQDREGSRFGQVAAIQGCALALREAGAAGVAVELPELLVLAKAAADREIVGVPLAVEGTVRILTAEALEVIHREREPGGPGRNEIRGCESKTPYILRQTPHYGSTDLGHHR